MKKLFKTAALLLACGAFFACSNDEVVENVSVLKGDKAYLAINLQYAEGGTRALGSYADATGNERTVNRVEFYFYDANGNYVTHAQWTSPASEADPTAPPQDIDILVEKNGKVLLEGLKNTGYPTYMTVVANQPAALNLENKTISVANTMVALAGAAVSGTEFIMTSAAKANGSDPVWKNYAVELQPAHFLEEAPTKETLTSDKAVNCYIERVAAKVSTSVATGLTAAATQDVTVGSTPYAGLSIYKINDTSIYVDRVKKDLYVGFTGWGLNVTAKEYFPFKNIAQTDSWMTAQYRSFWENVPIYGNSTATIYASNEFDAGSKSSTLRVDYNNYNEMGAKLGVDAVYCTPNTNTPAVYETNYNGRATCVLVRSVLLEKKADDSYQPITLYRYKGALYTESEYLKAVLSINSGMLPYKKKADDTYEAAGVADFMTSGKPNLYNLGDGGVGLMINATPDAASVDGKWYKKSATPAVYTDDTDTYATEASRKLFTGVSPEGSLADNYNNGMMYYSIPIEHNLAWSATNNYTASAYSVAASTAQVGDYGVVRNHAYQLTVNSVANIGHAVYDPTQDIVPNDKDSKLYYLGATINVLSWRNVTQSVGL